MTHPLYHMTNVPFHTHIYFTSHTPTLLHGSQFTAQYVHFTIHNQLNTQNPLFRMTHPLYCTTYPEHTSILMQDTPTLDISPFYCKKSTLLHDAPTQLYCTPTSPHTHIQFNTQTSTLLHDTSTLPYDRYSLHPLYCTHIHFTTQLFPSALFQQNNWLLLFCFWLDCNSMTD